MLVFFILSFFCFFLFSSNFINFFVFFVFIYFYYLLNMNMFFNSSLINNSDLFLYDEVSLFMTFLLFFIMFISYISSSYLNSVKLVSITFFLLFFFCFEVFNTIHLFSLYFYYESSLIPILFIIIKWGSYPERSVSSVMMISYTLLFGAPLFIIMIFLYYTNSSWVLLFYYYLKVSNLSGIFLFMCFAVKLPIYGLHYWLPMAHVEAPTFGSVILASLLLKLGGVGLFRVLPMISLVTLKFYFLSYFILFGIFSVIICCIQSDFKRLIAYSSISHMMVVPLLVLSSNIMSIQSIIFIMFFHGLSSTLLFFSVGILYTIFSSRQLILMRGLFLISPFFSFFLVLSFFYTMSAPPFPSYIAEVYFMFSTYFLSSYMLVFYIPFIFFGLVYNLNWFTSILMGSFIYYGYSNVKLSFMFYYPFILVMIFSFFSMFLLYCS